MFYNLDEQFLPQVDEVKNNSLFVINNYLGLTLKKDDLIRFSDKFIDTQVVIDNTQSLCLENQFKGYFSFCSPRKFLPVTDGGILFDDYDVLDKKSMPNLQDKSYERISWLFRCLDDLDKNSSYPEYLEFRNSIQNVEYSKMSNLSQFILCKLNIKDVVKFRNMNFKKLQKKIPLHNSFSTFTNLNELCSPIGYPLFVKDAKRTQSILKKMHIYTIIYWPKIDKKNLNNFENEILNKLLVFPINKLPSITQFENLIDTVK
jgi:hypothetical protein